MMRAALLALAPLLISASPHAAETCSAPRPDPVGPNIAANSTWYSDGMPPERFRGNRRTTIRFSSQDEINDLCGKAPCNRVTIACQQPKQLVMPNPCSYGANDQYAKILCHELAHLNGWPATHGD